MKITPIIVAIVLLVTTPLYAIEKNQLWEQQVNSINEFQEKLASLLLKEIPAAKEIILIQRDLQLVMIKMRSEKFYYLLENDPDRIVKDQGLSKWINFEWTKEDEEKLLLTNNKFKRLTAEYEVLMKNNQGHKQWPNARKKFSTIRETEDYITLQENLMNSLKAVGEELKK